MRRMKWLIVLALVLVLATLGSAGVLMLRRKSGTNKDLDKRMAWALTARVAVSVAIFLFVLLAYLLGWIHPTGLRAGQ
jgi:hypothetical protein